MEIRPGPCRWCSSYEHSAEMCPAGIKNFEKGLGRKENLSYSKDYNQSRNSYNDVFRLEQHQYREEGDHYEDVKRALIEMSLQMKALVGKNEELTRSLGELIRKTEIKEEQHQLQYTQHQLQIKRLTDQLEQVWATHELRSGKVIDNKVGMDTNLPYDFVQDPGMRGEQDEVWNDSGIQEEHQEKTSKGPEKKKATKKEEEKESEVALPYPHRLTKTKKDKQFSDLYSMFSGVQINLPLLQMIENVPMYANFF